MRDRDYLAMISLFAIDNQVISELIIEFISIYQIMS